MKIFKRYVKISYRLEAFVVEMYNVKKTIDFFYIEYMLEAFVVGIDISCKCKLYVGKICYCLVFIDRLYSRGSTINIVQMPDHLVGVVVEDIRYAKTLVPVST